MKILFFNQYFILPTEPGAIRTYWYCLDLVEKGHEVAVIRSKFDKIVD